MTLVGPYRDLALVGPYCDLGLAGRYPDLKLAASYSVPHGLGLANPYRDLRLQPDDEVGDDDGGEVGADDARKERTSPKECRTEAHLTANCETAILGMQSHLLERKSIYTLGSQHHFAFKLLVCYTSMHVLSFI